MRSTKSPEQSRPGANTSICHRGVVVSGSKNFPGHLPGNVYGPLVSSASVGLLACACDSPQSGEFKDAF